MDRVILILTIVAAAITAWSVLTPNHLYISG